MPEKPITVQIAQKTGSQKSNLDGILSGSALARIGLKPQEGKPNERTIPVRRIIRKMLKGVSLRTRAMKFLNDLSHLLLKPY